MSLIDRLLRIEFHCEFLIKIHFFCMTARRAAASNASTGAE